MTDHGGEKTSIPRPRRPEYLKTPYESPAKIGNGTGVESPFYDKPIEAGRPPLTIKGIEEAAPTSDLNAALDKIYGVVVRKIAYHEGELKQLRESLAKFAAIAGKAPLPPREAASMEDGIRAVLALADQLAPDGEQTHD
jgi:hypothetical protein